MLNAVRGKALWIKICPDRRVACGQEKRLKIDSLCGTIVKNQRQAAASRRLGANNIEDIRNYLSLLLITSGVNDLWSTK